ncbi:MAG TPA: hypothetical protein VFL98_00450 [Candidatus Paceibacterota bacterium]|nr:hypothetical protein [Candidatus Paceibacterota bacterium]
MKKYPFVLVIPLIAAGAALPATAFAMPMISADVGAQVGVTATASDAVYHGAMHGTDNAAGVHLDSAAGAQAAVGAGATVAVPQAAANGMTNASSTHELSSSTVGATVILPVDVTTKEDLSAYAKSLPAEDPSIVGADASADGSITVEYAQPAKLFGLIPVTIISHTTVTAGEDGNAVVKTTLPWWHILTSSSDLASLDSTLATSPSLAADVTADASASQQAQAIATIAEALAAHAKAQANLEATGSVNVQ